MDFLDPVKERRSRLRLMAGYCLIALAIGMAALLLIYQAYGYSIDRDGNVIQSGILFVSSQPSGANIYLNNQRYKSNTDSRVSIPAGTYTLRISEDKYRAWQRQVVVNGSDVQHFDYPFLFPQKLQTNSLNTLTNDPSIATQSPDKRWLLLGQTDHPGDFTEYDLKDPAKPVASTITLPGGSFTDGDAGTTPAWSLVEWAADNRHVLLQHTYIANGTASNEYILLDRDTPVDSVNLTATLKLSQTQAVSLFNNRVSQLYVYNDSSDELERINAGDGSVASKLDHILAFKPYAANEILYVTDRSPTGKTTDNQVTAVLQDGQKTIVLRTLPAGAKNYVLGVSQYAGDRYVAVGATNDSAVYVYKNPQDQTVSTVDSYPAPWRRLPVEQPNFVAFSGNTQFILAENGQEFVVYDLENVVQYHYHTTEPIDGLQGHAAWMDGDRLLYVSGGKLIVFDYDYRNRQTLVAASAAYLPFFAGDYTYLYTLRGGGADGTAKPALMSTPLTVKS